MAGTDSSLRRGAASVENAAAPVIILVHPQIGENIGFAARAMLNCGLTRLRLVAPREAWPNEKAVAAASGADVVLDGVEIFATTADAVADLSRLYAATARPRDMVKPVLGPREAAHDMRAAAAGVRFGILFGAERAGLDNDDVVRADAIIEAPLNPGFSSLNLGQAVLLCVYEWWLAEAGEPAPHMGRHSADLADKKELEDLYAHLEGELDAANFLYPPEKRPGMVRNIRNIFARAALTGREVRTLRGIVTALTKRKG
jgi:tRNA/rRNA methyltransferase